MIEDVLNSELATSAGVATIASGIVGVGAGIVFRAGQILTAKSNVLRKHLFQSYMPVKFSALAGLGTNFVAKTMNYFIDSEPLKQCAIDYIPAVAIFPAGVRAGEGIVDLITENYLKRINPTE